MIRQKRSICTRYAAIRWIPLLSSDCMFFVQADARPERLLSSAIHWNNAALQRAHDAHLGAPIVARALAIVHTCRYDAWAAYDKRAEGTPLRGVLRGPVSERTLANKERAISAERLTNPKSRIARSSAPIVSANN
jgi:hypothetical protein